MRQFIPTWLALAALTISGGAFQKTGDPAGLLPGEGEVPGWRADGAPRRFVGNELFDYIDGGGEIFIKLYLLKCLNYFNYRNELATRSEASRFRDFIMLATYGPLLLLFLIRVGLAKYYPFSRLEFMVIALYFLNVFPIAIFYTRIRYRLPFDFLLIALVALFLEQVLTRRTGLLGNARSPRQPA